MPKYNRNLYIPGVKALGERIRVTKFSIVALRYQVVEAAARDEVLEDW